MGATEPDRELVAQHEPSSPAGSSRSCSSTVHDTLSQEDDVCWICLLEGDELVRPCACPRYAHVACLARWQLQSAGTRRETHCEFCDNELPEWRERMTPSTGATAPAVMNVSFGSVAYSFEVQPGPSGYQEFSERVRAAFGLPDDSDLNITFTCDEPCEPANQLTLQGRGAFDAAVHCASVSAARRLRTHRSCAGTDFDPAVGGTADSPSHSAPSHRRTLTTAGPRPAPSADPADPQHVLPARGFNASRSGMAREFQQLSRMDTGVTIPREGARVLDGSSRKVGQGRLNWQALLGSAITLFNCRGSR
ncbi:hypothetical protein WJX73_002158 [Symbiochloris irregularis]|uniref:RING-CH-type domain-containing protein n=1 Tax=Symbiochloris irregularis TaxID=706552 RepID=A0AAW1PRM8_9CHLO